MTRGALCRWLVVAVLFAFLGCGEGTDSASAACPDGDEGCACLVGARCGDAEEGSALVCDAGYCVKVTCSAGILGCQCFNDATCSAPGTCENNRCVRHDCNPGDLACSCMPGNQCASGLRCSNGVVCIDATGFVGATCLPNSTCHQGNACVSGVCVPCDTGNAGCSCYSNGECFDGLACVAGTCVTEASEVADVPENPACHTPCRSGLTLEDGTYLPCSEEGLLDGCVGDKECRLGSCVVAGGAPSTCKSDVDCPDFQACIRGTCMSNCKADDECVGGLGCYRHVCRLRCTSTEEGNCPETQTCATVDGETGYCMPLQGPRGEPRRMVDGTFRVTEDFFAFSNVNTTGTFEIINDSPVSRDFVVRKVRHTEHTDSGGVEDTATPLFWIGIGEQGHVLQELEYSVRLDGGGGKATIVLSGADNDTIPSWDGTIEVRNSDLGVRSITLEYQEQPDGRWSGKMYYFANFPDSFLEEWVRDHDADPDYAEYVGNAFVQHWAAFKQGVRTYDELKAMLVSTRNESWKWERVEEMCAEYEGSSATCFPADNANGVINFTPDIDNNPIPTGVTELPISMNIAQSPNGPAGTYEGKIVSSQALQYGGDPAVSLSFATPPMSSPVCGTACLHLLDSFSADIVMGGRYIASPSDQDCDRAAELPFARVAIPWLVPGFQAGTDADANGLRYRYECRDQSLPFGDLPEKHPANLSFAGSNPIPDGRSRVRHLELVDGALINQTSLFIIFRESYDSFLGAGNDTSFSAYGYMVLERTAADLESGAYDGSTFTPHASEPDDVLEVGCSADLLDQILGAGTYTAPLPAGVLASVASGLLQGMASDVAGAVPLPSASEEVHYYCQDTGLFDNGPDGGVECPVGSRVEYFTVDPNSIDHAGIEALPCQQEYEVQESVVDGVPSTTVSAGSCWRTLELWRSRGAHSIRMNPVWQCTAPDQVYCDTHRLDLRRDKTFYASTGTPPVFVNIWAAIDNAFRYKTRFRNRQGKSIGFAPVICIPDSDQIPYCYEPPVIDSIRERVDCAVHLYVKRWADLDATTKETLKSYLTPNFAYEEVYDPVQDIWVSYDGFERLFSELLIMLGDEAYTASFASRFDLAGANMRSFEGALFEPNGINLAGGAGFEMFSLYQATQYYQMALDRFYSLSPLIWRSITEQGVDSFVTQETVVSYFDRLIRASTQKARAWSEVARRYQDFNRPDLARVVIERAYSSTYLESIALARIMLEVADITNAQNKPQIVHQIELAALGYRAAMLDMRDRYKSITDDPSLFGFAPDYVPFPALDANDTNAFERLLASTHQKLAVAAQKEAEALASNRSYETDAAVFQSELVRIRNNYENQLADICGTFVGEDGRTYPAIPRYAYLDERARLLGNPCGLMGNGMLHQEVGGLEIAHLDFKSVKKSWENVLEEVKIEQVRVGKQCSLIFDLANYQYEVEGEIRDLEHDIGTMRSTLDAINARIRIAGTTAELVACITGSSTDCGTKAAAAATYATVAALLSAASSVQQFMINARQDKIASKRQKMGRWVTNQQCDTAMVESNARVDTLLLRLMELELEALKAEYRIGIGASRLEGLHHQATRIMAEQAETEQLTINVEAARNDPNVRIYKNDAIITADRTFWSAVREAYKLTKVYEYYTSQSYARLQNLFLVRMVEHGDINLEAYVAELEDAFYEFEEQYGNPDLRVAIVSLRDDVLGIPRLADDGSAMSHADRIAQLRQRLADPRLLDSRGYSTMQFATSLGLLSPLTRNHKIHYIEAEIVGSDIGDTLGRVYLRQRGTGIVRNVVGEKSYYVFPERTAVVNPFFNGVRAFVPSIYRNDRLRDRPFVNTHWELVLNQRDENVNQDIDLQSLTDVRLYIYYTDFTEL